MTDVLIPMADGETLDMLVISGLLAQDTPLAVKIVTRERNPLERRISIGSTRSTLKLLASTDPVILLDSDVILANPNDVSDMLAFLAADEADAEGNHQWDAVALDTKGIYPVVGPMPEHIPIACAAVRLEALQQTDWTPTMNQIHDGVKGEAPYLCSCMQFKMRRLDGRENRIRYLDTRQLAEVGK